jgi:hypothetical protein
MNRRTLSTALLAAPFMLPGRAGGQAAATASSRQSAPSLFAVEFRIGPKWDASKAPHEQAGFGEHSANLKRLRDSGALLLGARYADKGFIVLAAGSEAAARGEIEVDPSVRNQVFAYDIHEFRVFYPGCVEKASAG